MSARHALAVLCVVLAACGFCDQPIETGQRWDDGTAPWRWQGPVEVCLGAARLVPPAALPEDSGVCRATAAPAPVCTDAAGCSEGEACICGVCTVQLCRFSAECGPGRACTGTPRRCADRCESDADCAPGRVCDAQACVRTCAGDAACASGERCLAGRCGVLPCGPGGPSCGGGEVCAAQQTAGALAAPGAIQLGPETILHLELTGDGGTAAILRATSRDGRRFTATPGAPVLAPPPPATRVSTPAALVHPGGAVDLYVALDAPEAIARARSPDGITFGPAEIILEPALPWEAGRVASPQAVLLGADVLLFYEGGAGAGIGLARSAGGSAPFERIGDGPLLTAADADGSERWSAVTELGGPGVIEIETPLGDRVLRLFFDATGVEAAAGEEPDGGPPPANPSVGLATIPIQGDPGGLSPLTWPYNPVLFRIQAFEPLTEREPSVIQTGSEPRLYFDDGAGVVHLATPSLR